MKNILYILALSFRLVACKAKEMPQEEPKLPEIGYSNLLDEDTKNEVKEVIAKYLDGESVERFIGQTSLYNSTIKTESLVQKGYGKLDTTEEKYDMGTIVVRKNISLQEIILTDLRHFSVRSLLKIRKI